MVELVGKPIDIKVLAEITLKTGKTRACTSA